MSSLQEKYRGAQDAYFIPNGLHPKTFESEYLDTQTSIVSWEKEDIQPSIPEDARAEYTRICRLYKEKLADDDDPFFYAEEMAAMMKKYKEQGIWELLKNIDKPLKKKNIVTVEFLQKGEENLGFTGLRFAGDPSAVESISLEIGGQRFDKIYPSITGQFDRIQLFDTVVPNPIYHKIWARIVFLKEDVPLEVSYDRVVLKGTLKNYEAIYSSNQYVGAESVKKGKGTISLPYNHPVESIRILSKDRLTNVVLTFDKHHRLHCPFKGIQNGMYLYEISFNCLINFSRIENARLEFEAKEDTTMYPFAKTWNVGRFMNGMAGIAFSK
jgi:hypothetical protein